MYVRWRCMGVWGGGDLGVRWEGIWEKGGAGEGASRRASVGDTERGGFRFTISLPAI